MVDTEAAQRTHGALHQAVAGMRLLAASWMSRVSRLSHRVCRCCAETRDLCNEACEQHAPHHELCGPGGRECRRCAETCREMLVGTKLA
jgi:hypothetical protein